MDKFGLVLVQLCLLRKTRAEYPLYTTERSNSLSLLSLGDEGPILTYLNTFSFPTETTLVLALSQMVMERECLHA